MNVNINGRGRLTAKATVCESVVIRIGDATRPDFWAEIRLSPSDLRQLLLACEVDFEEAGNPVTDEESGEPGDPAGFCHWGPEFR